MFTSSGTISNFLPGDSDLLTVYNAYCGWKRARGTPGSNEFSFCRKNFLNPQTLLGIEDVKMQLVVSIADAGLLTLDPSQKSALNRLVNPFCFEYQINSYSPSNNLQGSIK